MRGGGTPVGKFSNVLTKHLVHMQYLLIGMTMNNRVMQEMCGATGCGVSKMYVTL